jgi:hypothetical protein
MIFKGTTVPLHQGAGHKLGTNFFYLVTLLLPLFIWLICS